MLILCIMIFTAILHAHLHYTRVPVCVSTLYMCANIIYCDFGLALCQARRLLSTIYIYIYIYIYIIVFKYPSHSKQAYFNTPSMPRHFLHMFIRHTLTHSPSHISLCQPRTPIQHAIHAVPIPSRACPVLPFS